MFLLIGLVGIAVVQAEAYSSSQRTFLAGGDPVASMDDFPFEGFVESYWSSYMDSPKNITAPLAQSGAETNGMSVWMIGFPLSTSSSSFKTNVSSEDEAEPAPVKYDIGLGGGQAYVPPFMTNEESVKKNCQYLEDRVKSSFGQ